MMETCRNWDMWTLASRMRFPFIRPILRARNRCSADLNDLGIIGQRIPNFDEDSCNGCKKCSIEAACPMKAAKVVDGVLEIDKSICNNCGRCIGKCHFDAIEDGQTGSLSRTFERQEKYDELPEE